MFYNAHAYIAQKLYGTNDPLLIVGSILPDMAITKIFDWNKNGLHGIKNSDNFHKFIKSKYPEFEYLALGVVAHNILDDFSHKNYTNNTGYAYQNNKELIKKIHAYYKEGNEVTLRKAHNFIETGVDISLLYDDSNIYEEIRKSIDWINREKLTIILSKYFKIEEKKILKALIDYFGLITEYDLTLKDNWILLWVKLNKLMELKNLDKEKLTDLIDTGIKAVSPTYEEFLSFSVYEGENSKSLYV